MRPNEWLEDKEFIKNAEYSDLYYLETLCHHVSSFLKNVPIPVLSTLDRKNWRIFLSVGHDKKGIKFSSDIAPYDFITLCRNYLNQFYPKYEIDYEVEEDYSDDEYVRMVKEGMNLNDVLLMKKKITKKEIGIIEKTMFPNDQFIINLDGIRMIRMSGTMNNPMLLKEFLPKIKNFENDLDKKNFIFENSTLVKVLDNDCREIEINYQGKMLINFFHINYNELEKSKITKIDDFNYQIGRFIIHFSGPQLRDDCLSYLKNRKETITKE